MDRELYEMGPGGNMRLKLERQFDFLGAIFEEGPGEEELMRRIKDIEKTEDLSKGDPHVWIADNYMQLGRFGDALTHYRLALDNGLEDYPRHEILHNMAESYRGSENLEKAIEAQMASLSVNEDPNFMDLAAMGGLFEEAGMESAALAMYCLSVKLDRTAFGVYDKMFGILKKRGEEQLVKKMCKALFAEFPDNSRAKKLYGEYVTGVTEPKRYH